MSAYYNECCICLEDKISSIYCITPNCHATLCPECSKKYDDNKCPLCRQEYSLRYVNNHYKFIILIEIFMGGIIIIFLGLLIFCFTKFYLFNFPKKIYVYIIIILIYGLLGLLAFISIVQCLCRIDLCQRETFYRKT